jgi:hypothetical protein
MLIRAGLRQAWRSMKKPAGMLVAIFMIAMLSFGMLPSFAMVLTSANQTQSEFSSLVTNSIPLLMFAMAVALVATESGNALLELRPAELQFVLAGPFTNSHILSYRLLTMLIGWMPLCMFFALFMLPHTGSLVGSYFGIAFGGAFITLIALQYTLLRPRLSPNVLRLIRLGALFGLMFIMLEASLRVMGQDDPFSISKLSGAINEGFAARILSLPFRPFAAAISGPVDQNLLLNLALSFALVASAAFCCYRTNSGFSELAVEGVARRRKKLERIKGGNVYGFSTGKAERSQLIPMPGWLGGAGPVAWSQLTSTLRRTGRLVPGLICIGVVAAAVAAVLLQLYPDAIPKTLRFYAVPIALGVATYIGFLVTMTAQTGFSSNPRLLVWYQTLPIRPMAIAIGMSVGTIALLVSIQAAICLPAIVVTSQSLLQSLAICFLGLAFNVAFASTINFISATTDLRPMPQGTPDVFQGARGMIFMLVLGVAMLPIVLLGIGSAGIVGAILGYSWVTCSVAAGIAIMTIPPLLWWVSGEQFVKKELTVD